LADPAVNWVSLAFPGFSADPEKLLQILSRLDLDFSIYDRFTPFNYRLPCNTEIVPVPIIQPE
jgi:hypothetical protein